MSKLCRTKQMEKDYNITIKRVNNGGYFVFEYYSNLDKSDDLYISCDSEWLETLDEVEEDIHEELLEMIASIESMQYWLVKSYYSEEKQKDLIKRFYEVYPTFDPTNNKSKYSMPNVHRYKIEQCENCETLYSIFSRRSDTLVAEVDIKTKVAKYYRADCENSASDKLEIDLQLLDELKDFVEEFIIYMNLEKPKEVKNVR